MVMAFKSETPHIAPKVLTVSYSGPSPRLPFQQPSLISVPLPQAIGQAKQLTPLTKTLSVNAWPFTSSICSKTPSCQLRVGYPPLILTISETIFVTKDTKPTYRCIPSQILTPGPNTGNRHFLIRVFLD